MPGISKLKKTKIVLFSDHPAANSGLARITRDLALGIHNNLSDVLEVATLGYGSPGSSTLPFPQFHWHQRDDFLPLELPYIWRDFVGDAPGVLMTIGDIQRFLALADTQFSMDRSFAQWMPEMRRGGKLKLWGYFPIDAHNKDGKLGPQLGHTLSHYDRRLVPSEWAGEIVRKTIPGIPVDVLPHGIHTDVFHPHPKEESRDNFSANVFPAIQWPKEGIEVPDDALWIGIVATNQSRKDWGLGVEVVAELRKSRPVFLWCHIDVLKREWSMLELLSDFGLLQSSMVTVGNLPDLVMASCYSAMDCTLGIGRGEGFGYPIFESIFCGAPCIASEYGAHAEYNQSGSNMWVDRMRMEGPLNLVRPIHSPGAWVKGIIKAVDDPEPWGDKTIELSWDRLWPRFDKWFREGL